MARLHAREDLAMSHGAYTLFLNAHKTGLQLDKVDKPFKNMACGVESR